MIRLLFVNDEKEILRDLESGLQPCARQWQMRFVASAEEALAELAREPAQLVASDVGMPGMDGAVFLGQVRRLYPETVRFVLGRNISRGDAARVMPVAHQVLTQPHDFVTLRRAIERVTALLGRTGVPAVRQVVAAVHKLPPLPAVYHQLSSALEQPDADSAKVATIVERDPAISARLLQMANSPYYSFGHPVRSVRDAATRLGLQQLRSTVLLLAMSAMKTPLPLPKGFSIAAVQERSQRVAGLASAMLSHAEERKTAFSAGMLHHIGYFVLAPFMEQGAGTPGAGKPVQQLESELLGCDHAEVGAFMLTLLGLPLPLVEAVAHHHRPSASGEPRFGPVAALHVACLLAAQAEGLPVADEAWDGDFLGRMGALEMVGRWRNGEPIKAVF